MDSRVKELGLQVMAHALLCLQLSARLQQPCHRPPFSTEADRTCNPVPEWRDLSSMMSASEHATATRAVKNIRLLTGDSTLSTAHSRGSDCVDVSPVLVSPSFKLNARATQSTLVVSSTAGTRQSLLDSQSSGAAASAQGAAGHPRYVHQQEANSLAAAARARVSHMQAHLQRMADRVRHFCVPHHSLSAASVSGAAPAAAGSSGQHRMQHSRNKALMARCAMCAGMAEPPPTAHAGRANSCECSRQQAGPEHAAHVCVSLPPDDTSGPAVLEATSSEFHASLARVAQQADTAASASSAQAAASAGTCSGHSQHCMAAPMQVPPLWVEERPACLGASIEQLQGHTTADALSLTSPVGAHFEVVDLATMTPPLSASGAELARAVGRADLQQQQWGARLPAHSPVVASGYLADRSMGPSTGTSAHKGLEYISAGQQAAPQPAAAESATMNLPRQGSTSNAQNSTQSLCRHSNHTEEASDWLKLPALPGSAAGLAAFCNNLPGRAHPHSVQNAKQQVPAAYANFGHGQTGGLS